MSDTIKLPFPIEECKTTENYMMLQISANNEEILDNMVEEFYENYYDLTEEMLIAGTETQEDTFWAIREFIAYAANKDGYVFMYDLSIEAEKIHEMIEFARELYGDKAKYVYGFGHIGDDMSHVDICLKEGVDVEETKEECEAKFFQWVTDNGGSISSEHGIGQVKTEYMDMVHDSAILQSMKALKASFDPKNTLNPGKLLSDGHYKL